jgi:hypothetical protein
MSSAPAWNRALVTRLHSSPCRVDQEASIYCEAGCIDWNTQGCCCLQALRDTRPKQSSSCRLTEVCPAKGAAAGPGLLQVRQARSAHALDTHISKPALSQAGHMAVVCVQVTGRATAMRPLRSSCREAPLSHMTSPRCPKITPSHLQSMSPV